MLLLGELLVADFEKSQNFQENTLKPCKNVENKCVLLLFFPRALLSFCLKENRFPNQLLEKWIKVDVFPGGALRMLPAARAAGVADAGAPGGSCALEGTRGEFLEGATR